MWAKTVPLGDLVFGATYVGCGTIQVTAGIVFLVLPAVLRTGSNAWSGILTILSGCLLLNISREKAKAKVLLGIHAGVLLTNICNLLLTELYEWRAFLATDQIKEFIRQPGNVTFLLTAYFSTTVPTVIAFVASFLATQYSCCILVTTKTSKKKRNAINSDRSSVSYDWVFQEKDEENTDTVDHHVIHELESHDWISEKSSVDDLLIGIDQDSSLRNCPTAATIVSASSPIMFTYDHPTFCLRTFSNPFRNVPATFHPLKWSSQMSSDDGNKTDEAEALSRTFTVQENCLNELTLPTIQVSIESSASSTQNYLMSESPVCSVDTDWLSSTGGDHATSSPVPTVPISVNDPIRDVQSRLHAPPQQVAYSSDLPRVEWCLPSRPLATSMDSDSLVYLKHLELLARQWRIDHEHQKLRNDVSKRISLDSN